MAAIDPRITIEEFLDSHDLEYERKDANTFLVSLPGEKKLQTHCALIVGDHSLSINAFVIRKPDDNAAGVHAYCMLKNAGMYGIAFAKPSSSRGLKELSLYCKTDPTKRSSSRSLPSRSRSWIISR